MTVIGMDLVSGGGRGAKLVYALGWEGFSRSSNSSKIPR